jgi:hypothetical protein
MKNKIAFMLNNPDVMIFKPSDSNKGSTSSILYGYMSNIDKVKAPLQDILNFKVEVDDLEKFFQDYIEYGKEYHLLLELLKSVEQKGANLLTHVKSKDKIRDRRLRERIISLSKPGTEEKSTKAPVAKAPAKKAPVKKVVAKKTTTKKTTKIADAKETPANVDVKIADEKDKSNEETKVAV